MTQTITIISIYVNISLYMRIIFDHALLYGCDSSEIFSPVMQENDAEYVKRRHTKGYNTSQKKKKKI